MPSSPGLPRNAPEGLGAFLSRVPKGARDHTVQVAVRHFIHRSPNREQATKLIAMVSDEVRRNQLEVELNSQLGSSPDP